ncbi:MAG: SGNH/GDSL hydrolase family protein [Pseudobutyrivibrio sp.]|nr:SGNH/GDSL hydrolase family protein [Pseudobutyrivibrio sp.]
MNYISKLVAKTMSITRSAIVLLLILFIMPGSVAVAAELDNSQEIMPVEAVDTEMAVDTEIAPDITPDITLPETEAVTLEDGVYNILAIGNSITVHPICSYWWGSWGMAASSIDKDYIHLVQSGLMEKYGLVSLDIIPVQSWETSTARSKQLKKFDEKLANSYDLVIIQLGENVNDTTTFKKDFNKLVEYVKTAQPDAKIVVIGDFWYRKGRDTAKKDVAVSQGCEFVDLSEIRGVKQYMPEKGTKVLGHDGKLHTITKASVLKHPNDLGMEFIANKVLEAVE